MTSKVKKPAARKKAPAKRARRTVLLVATRKGAWLFHGDAGRKAWRVDGPHFLGHTISHLVLDPRDGKTLLAAAKDRASGADHLSLDRHGSPLEGGRATAGIRQGA